MSLATWKMPESISASKKESINNRTRHYRFKMKHFLNDGTRVIPTIPTVNCILDAYDHFGLSVAIDKNSYVLYTSNDDY